MAKQDKAGVFIDCKKLRRVLYRAQKCMTKADRIIYGTPSLALIGDIIGEFILAYDLKGAEKKYHIDQFLAKFYVLKTDIETMNEFGIIKETKDSRDQNILDDDGNIIETVSGENFNAIRREMTELVARIDSGMQKWRNSVVLAEDARESSPRAFEIKVCKGDVKSLLEQDTCRFEITELPRHGAVQ